MIVSGLALLPTAEISAQQKHGGGQPGVEAGTGMGQADSAQQRADQEAITDLGRLFGFLLRMDQEEPHLALNSSQISAVLGVMNTVRNSSVISGDMARDITIEIEDDILLPAQLMYTDRLFLQRDQGRSGDSVADSGASSASQRQSNRGASVSAPLSSSNPFLDRDRAMGADFLDLYDYLKSKL